MTRGQTIIAEARALARDEGLDTQERIDLLMDLVDDLRNLIDEIRSEADDAFPGPL
jgi:hypothetical protein